MFKDYYTILEVSEIATNEEIKVAFKRQALKWHPDRNIGKDTTSHMQEINEAYLILKDNEARDRYNIEYQRFKQYQRQSAQREKQKEKTYEYTDYNIYDDVLKKWMDNAKKQAVDLAQQTIRDLNGMVKVGAKAAGKEAGKMFIAQIVIGVITLIIFGLVKACSGN
jgi:DnaJ-class molecular chaperone